MGHNLEDVTFHGRDHVRDDGRSIKEKTFVMGCITTTCKYHVRDVRSFEYLTKKEAEIQLSQRWLQLIQTWEWLIQSRDSCSHTQEQLSRDWLQLSRTQKS